MITLNPCIVVMLKWWILHCILCTNSNHYNWMHHQSNCGHQLIFKGPYIWLQLTNLRDWMLIGKGMPWRVNEGDCHVSMYNYILSCAKITNEKREMLKYSMQIHVDEWRSLHVLEILQRKHFRYMSRLTPLDLSFWYFENKFVQIL